MKLWDGAASPKGQRPSIRIWHRIRRPTPEWTIAAAPPGLPVAAYDDLSAFKIYLVDVGLLRRLAQLAPTAFGEGNRPFTECKGSLTENFVLQTLVTQFEVVPHYWSQNNPPYEVDFLIQQENNLFPIEVKSQVDSHHREETMNRIKELQDFITRQKTDITEFDEALVNKLIEKITVFADHFTVEFKSDVTFEIEA